MYFQDQKTNDLDKGFHATGIREHSAEPNPDVALDLGSLRCPMFGLKSMIALRSLEPGQSLEITTKNPGARKALGRVSWMTKTEMVASYEDRGQFKHLLKKELINERHSRNLRHWPQ
jgi:TusA-related sulfurtransferase